MYPVSAAYKTAIKQSVRDVRITGTITLKDNTIINLTDEDIVQGSLYITEQCVAGEDIEVGNVYASEMGLALSAPLENPYRLDGARILLHFGLDVSEDGSGLWETVPLGYFYVTDIQRKLTTVTLTALDGMMLFDIPVGEPGSRTPRGYITYACARAGITLGSSISEIDSLPNAAVQLAEPDPTKIKTCRDLLMWACQILGSFARMNRAGELEVIPIAARERVKALEKKERFSSDVSDFAVRITKVSMQVGETEYSQGYDGMTMILDENPLMAELSPAQINSALANLLDQLNQVIYVPFNSDFMGDPALQPGDFIDIRDAGVLESETYFFSAAAPLEVHVDIIRSIITHSTWRYRGKHNIRGAGKSGIVRGVQNQQIKAVSSVLAIAQAAQDLALSADQSTQLIKDAIGGHVLIRQNPDETNEILIMDHPDPELATKIWRWNMGGLGYSDNVTGADNPDREYEVAMTMDGAINANFVKTGILNAAFVNILSAGGNLQIDGTGLKMYDSDNNLRVQIGKDELNQYLVEVIGGKIHSSTISTGVEGAKTYIILKPAPTNAIEMWTDVGGVSKKQFEICSTEGYSGATIHFLQDNNFGVILGFDADKKFTITNLRPSISGERENHISADKTTIGGELHGGNPWRNTSMIRGNAIYPLTDMGGPCGDENNRWTLVRGYNVQSGDMCFDERECAICGQPFVDGDILCLLVRTVHDNYCTMTIPVHEQCKNVRKIINIKLPKMVTKYRLNEQGEKETYTEMAIESEEKEVVTIHPDFEMDEFTGKFRRKLNDYNLTLFNKEELEAGVYTTDKVAKVTDILKTNQIKYVDHVIEIGGPLK